MQGLLESIRGFNSNSLTNVFTTERKAPVVTEKPKPNFHWHFGHEDEEEKIEWFDDPKDFREKCKEIAKMIKESKHCVVYTGAGISTSAKLPDYRGSDGMWTNRDQGTSMDKTKYVETISSALPTLAHMAISELVRRDLVKFVVSTNVDGLHMRSGIPMDKLAELHGNSYLETCEKCKTKYLRDRDILQNQTEEHRLVNRHWCGGRCDKDGCGGLLLDSIVAFGENLPEDHLHRATEESKKGDFAFVLGTTMMVQPACLLPGYIYKKKGGKMIICNLQKTQYDPRAAFTVHGHTDDILFLVMEELGIQIPRETTLFKIPAYVEEIDAKHNKRIVEVKKQLEEIAREKKENPNGRSNALTRGEDIYNRAVISLENESDHNLKFAGLQLVFFNHSKNCEFTIVSKTKKIVVEDCHNLVLTASEKIVTHTMEIINSSNITVNINTQIFTITCDNSDNISLIFQKKDDFELAAWAKATNCSLTVEGIPIQIIPKSTAESSNSDGTSTSDSSTTVDLKKDQIITRKYPTGEILSKVTRRDQCGRIVELV